MVNIDNIRVTKRDGSIIPLDISKINQVVEWACHEVTQVAASDIVMNANIEFYDLISTQEIHDILIDSAVRLIKKSTNYQYVASRLLTFNLRKTIYGAFTPKSLYEVVKKNVKIGVYNDVILKKYNRKEFDFFDSEINHTNDFNFTHAGMKQMVDKYLVQDRSTGEIYETPQIAFMLVPMYAFRNYTDKDKRTQIIIDFYKSLNEHEINLPTPIIAGLRTPKEQFSSCTVITCGDTLQSISATDDAIFNYTAMRAGIGLDVGAIRPLGSKIRSGEVVYTGIITFLKKFHATNKSCTQNGIRGGAMTVHLPWWHPEIEDFIVIKNDKGSNDARIPGIDPAIQLDSVFFDRAKKGKKLTLMSPSDFPEVYENFGRDNFKELYEEAEREIKKNPTKYSTSRKIDAREMLTSVARERVETGRLYVHFIDNANKYTPYLDRIRSSNLCMEIEIANSPLNEFDDPNGEVALCTLGAVNWANTKLDRIPKVTELLVRLLDEILDIQEYPLKAAETYNKKYRPLGVGISSFADWLAVRKQKYSFGSFDKTIYEQIHEWSEAQQFYLIKASVELAKEKGKMEYFDRTKWKDAVLPTDYKNKVRDSLHDFELKQDWEGLREEIKEHGVRHVVTGACMPAESSSVVWNISNGLEPVRNLIVEKTSGTNRVTQVAKHISKHSKYYQSPWDEDWSNTEFLRILSIVQKFTDQGMSVNLYSDPGHSEGGKISIHTIIKDIMYAHALGHKSLYYQNINDNSGDTDSDDDGCGSGGCKL